jgi:hypothetical protein
MTMKHFTKLTALAGLAVASLSAVPAHAQEVTEDRPFSGVYIGAAGGYDIQNNDTGSSILFDRNGDGNFSDSVNTHMVAATTMTAGPITAASASMRSAATSSSASSANSASPTSPTAPPASRPRPPATPWRAS